MTSKVWQTSQTFDGRLFGPDKTVLLKQFWQKICPQCLQWCLCFSDGKLEWHAGHLSTSSSCCHRTSVSDSRIFSNCTWNYNNFNTEKWDVLHLFCKKLILTCYCELKWLHTCKLCDNLTKSFCTASVLSNSCCSEEILFLNSLFCFSKVS